MAAPRPGLSAPLLLLRGLPGRLPITSRVSLVLLGVGLLPLLTSQWLALQAFKRTLLLNQLEQTGRIAQARVDELEGFVTQTTLALEELAQTPQVREDIRGLVARKAEAPLTSTALSERYRKLAGELRLESLYLADSRGQLLLASQQATPGAAGPSGVPARLSTTLVAATSGFGRGFAGPLADPASRLYLTYLAVPVVNTPGRPLGVVGAALEASGFSRLLGSEHFGLGDSARVSLVGVLTSQRGQRLIPLGPRGEALNGHAFDFEPLHARLGEAPGVISSQGDQGRFRGGDGVERIGSWRRLRDGDIGLLVSLERREALESATNLRGTLLTLVLLTTAAVAGAGVLLGRSLTRPLRRLHGIVQDFDAAGEQATPPIPVQGNDEIAALATT